MKSLDARVSKIEGLRARASAPPVEPIAVILLPSAPSDRRDRALAAITAAEAAGRQTVVVTEVPAHRTA